MWRSHACDVTRSCVRHEAVMCATCPMANGYARHDSVIFAMQSYLGVSFIRDAAWCIHERHTHVWITHTHMNDREYDWVMFVKHPYVCVSFICVCVVHECITPHHGWMARTHMNDAHTLCSIHMCVSHSFMKQRDALMNDTHTHMTASCLCSIHMCVSRSFMMRRDTFMNDTHTYELHTHVWVHRKYDWVMLVMRSYVCVSFICVCLIHSWCDVMHSWMAHTRMNYFYTYEYTVHMIESCLWCIHMCVSHSFMKQRDAFMNETHMTHTHMNALQIELSRIRRGIRVSVCHAYVCVSFICATWCNHKCDVMQSYVRHDSVMFASWLIRVWDITHSHVRGHTCECATSHTPTRMCDMTHSSVRYFSSICVAFHMSTAHTYVWYFPYIYAAFLIHLHDISHESHTYVQHFSWLIHMCCIFHKGNARYFSSICAALLMSEAHPYVRHCSWVKLIHMCGISRTYMPHVFVFSALQYPTRAPQLSANHCNTRVLQHTATHCDRLQHTATDCNRLQQAATHCNVRKKQTISNACAHTHMHDQMYTEIYTQYTATHCNTLQQIATRYNAIHTFNHRNLLLSPCREWEGLFKHTAPYILQHTATHCNTLQHTATDCNTLQRRPL